MLITIPVILLLGGFLLIQKSSKTDEQQQSQEQTNVEKSEAKSMPKPKKQKTSFDKTKYSLSEPTSIWLVVNKNRPISTSFIPASLVKPDVPTDPGDSYEEKQVNQQIANSVEDLFSDAKKQGFNLFLASGYRSAKLQSTVYNGYVARDGQAAADKYSARPGTSEHQTGWAFDVARIDRKCYLDICFGDTADGQWLANNAHRYGFTIRYREGKESITGYQYEPWHLRYVGTELANELYKSDQTLEEFFDL